MAEITVKKMTKEEKKVYNARSENKTRAPKYVGRAFCGDEGGASVTIYGDCFWDVSKLLFGAVAEQHGWLKG